MLAYNMLLCRSEITKEERKYLKWFHFPSFYRWILIKNCSHFLSAVLLILGSFLIFFALHKFILPIDAMLFEEFYACNYF